MKKLLTAFKNFINPNEFSSDVPEDVKCVVIGLIKDLSFWEMGMFRSHKTSLGWYDTVIPYEGKQLEEIMQKWCTDDVIIYESFGFPLKHDPQTERIIGFSKRKSMCAVRTIYSYTINDSKGISSSYDTHYEYLLQLVNNEWKVDSLWILHDAGGKSRYF